MLSLEEAICLHVPSTNELQRSSAASSIAIEKRQAFSQFERRIFGFTDGQKIAVPD